MQTYPHTPPAAQHLPVGWPMPMHATQLPDSSVLGGGVAQWETETRVRWGRILIVTLGMALAAFGIWNLTNSDSGSATTGSSSGSNSRQAAAQLTSTDKVDDAASADAARQARALRVPKDATSKSPGATPRVLPKTSTGAPANRATTLPRAAVRATGVGTGAGAAARAATARAATGNRVGSGHGAHRAAARATTTGGGAAPQSLPYTGAETWIAAIFGVLILSAGILLQVHAVRIGMLALLYRRGILLRPVDCARLAGERGLPALRVWLSGVLLRLLAEPRRSDFVSAH